MPKKSKKKSRNGGSHKINPYYEAGLFEFADNHEEYSQAVKRAQRIKYPGKNIFLPEHYVPVEIGKGWLGPKLGVGFSNKGLLGILKSTSIEKLIALVQQCTGYVVSPDATREDLIGVLDKIDIPNHLTGILTSEYTFPDTSRGEEYVQVLDTKRYRIPQPRKLIASDTGLSKSTWNFFQPKPRVKKLIEKTSSRRGEPKTFAKIETSGNYSIPGYDTAARGTGYFGA